MINLPFTPAEFFAVFRQYNAAVWPLPALFTIVAFAALSLVLLRGRAAGHVISAILAFLWAWTGVVYHLVFFLPVNPAAAIFGVISLVAAAAFAWHGVVEDRLQFECAHTPRCLAALLLATYALVVYPIIPLFLGRAPLEVATFGLPCPTTLFTIAMLGFLKPPFTSRFVFVVPVLWAIIGAQAAWLLGVYEDLGLLVAAVAALWFALPSGREGKPA